MIKIGLSMLLLSTIIPLLLLGGCSDEESPLNNNNTEPVTIASVTPPDGAIDVETASSITLKFSGPVDTLSIMSSFHLGGGAPMHDWRDSLDRIGGFGMMGMHDSERMVAWMDSIQLPGRFHWNDALDSCAFVPDTLFATGTDYLCLLYEGGMRGQHGGMMGGAQHDDSGYHMFQFRTRGGGQEAPGLVATMPPDGATEVDRNGPMALIFSVAMDTVSVSENFYFCGGEEMTEWMDSLEHHRGMGGMGMVDMGHMMEWLDAIAMPGEFEWSDGMDTCWFDPDSTLMPQHDYMVYLTDGACQVHGHPLATDHLRYDGYMIHFRTAR